MHAVQHLTILFLTSVSIIIGVAAIFVRPDDRMHPAAISIIAMIIFAICTISSWDVGMYLDPATGDSAVEQTWVSWPLIGFNFIGFFVMLLYSLTLIFGSLGKTLDDDFEI